MPLPGVAQLDSQVTASGTVCRVATTLVVSSLVSSIYVRLHSPAFKSTRRPRPRTLTAFGELLSQLLKIGRSAVQLRQRR